MLTTIARLAATAHGQGQCGVGGGERGFLSPHGALQLETKVREIWSFTIMENAPNRAFSWLKTLFHIK